MKVVKAVTEENGEVFLNHFDCVACGFRKSEASVEIFGRMVCVSCLEDVRDVLASLDDTISRAKNK